jgi:hypothetical protein
MFLALASDPAVLAPALDAVFFSDILLSLCNPYKIFLIF